MNKELKLKASQLFNQGLTLKEISKTLSVNYSTLRTWKKNNFSTVSTLDKEPLTEQEEKFCIFYADTCHVYTSALKAGYSESYALNTIYQLMKKPKIKKRIKELKAIRITANEITENDILQMHKEFVFNRELQQCFDEKTGKLKSNIKNIKKFKIKETDEGTETTIELVDPKTSLEFLGKYMGIDPTLNLAKEKLELERVMIKNKIDKDNIDTQLKVASFILDYEEVKNIDNDIVDIEKLQLEYNQWTTQAWADVEDIETEEK
ncbi:MAG: terminase small subunit [Sarcina sp.]